MYEDSWYVCHEFFHACVVQNSLVRDVKQSVEQREVGYWEWTTRFMPSGRLVEWQGRILDAIKRIPFGSLLPLLRACFEGVASPQASFLGPIPPAASSSHLRLSTYSRVNEAVLPALQLQSQRAVDDFQDWCSKVLGALYQTGPCTRLSPWKDRKSVVPPVVMPLGTCDVARRVLWHRRQHHHQPPRMQAFR